jgi:hypothetical protein
MPISWRETLKQYVGRLHCLHKNKKVVQVYDYVDTRVPMLTKIYQKRLGVYITAGYRFEDRAKISFQTLRIMICKSLLERPFCIRS